ncbi:hypothetical protein QTN25_002275 [Entamoeba marina]
MSVDYKELYYLKIQECRSKHCSKDVIQRKEKEMNQRAEQIEKENRRTITTTMNDMKLVSLEQQVQSKSDIIKQKDGIIQQLTKEKRELVQLLKDANNRYETQHKETIITFGKHKDELTRLQTETEKTQERLKQLITDTNEWKQQQQEQKIQYPKHDMNFENDELRKRLKDLINSECDYHRKLCSLQNKNDELQQKIALILKEKEVVSKQLNQAKNTSDESTYALEQLKHLSQKKQKEIEALKDSKGELAESMSAMQNRIRKLEDDNLILQNDLKKSLEQQKRLKKSNEKFKNQFEILADFS